MLKETTPDAALLDMNLTGNSSVELASRLVADRVHVAFLTGNRPDLLPETLANPKVYSKPADIELIVSDFRQVHIR